MNVRTKARCLTALFERCQHNTWSVINKESNCLRQQFQRRNISHLINKLNSEQEIRRVKPFLIGLLKRFSTDRVTILNLINDQSNSSLKIEWEDGSKYEFPHIFLRDNCQCPKCFHPDVKTRLLDTIGLIDVDIFAKEVKFINGEVHIIWPDDHLSIFNSAWLRENIYTEESDIQPEYFFGIKQRYWGNEIMKREIPFIEYSNWIDKDEYVMNHIEMLIKYGLVIIKNGPPDALTGRKMAERMGLGFNKLTHYGSVNYYCFQLQVFISEID